MIPSGLPDPATSMAGGGRSLNNQSASMEFHHYHHRGQVEDD